MKFISPIFSDARASLGGTTFARNASGTYARARVAPTQPRTVSQQANRSRFAAAASSWRTLSQAQITAWNALAPTITWANSLGQTFNPSGMQLFMQLQRNLQESGNLPQLSAPGAPPALDSPSPLSLVATTTAGVLTTLTLTPPADLLTQVQNLVLKLTSPFSPTVSFVVPSSYRALPGPLITDGTAVTSVTGSVAGALSNTAAADTAIANPTTITPGFLTQVKVGWGFITAPGASFSIQICKVNAGVVTVLGSFTVPAPATIGVATYNAGTDFASLWVPSGCYLFASPSSGNELGYTAPTSGQTFTAAGPSPLVTGAAAFGAGGTASLAVTTTTYTGSSTINALPQYLNLFSQSALGQKIAARLYVVDPSSGYATPEASTVTIVTGT